MGRGRRVLKLVMLTIAVAVVGSLGGATLALAAEEAPDDEAGLRALVNRERSAVGLGTLVEAQDLLAVARRHSGRMAGRDEVFHNSNLASEVDGWQLLGENVGSGATVAEIHDALMASKIHRDVILQPRFTEMGVGVLRVGESIWVTQVFRQPDTRPAPSTTTTAPPSVTAAAEPPPGDPAPPATTPGPTTAPPARVEVKQSERPVEGEARAQDAAKGAAGAVRAPDVDAVKDAVVLDVASSPLAAGPLPRPGPPSVPGLGVAAAALLLAVVGSASLTTRAAGPSQPKRAAV